MTLAPVLDVNTNPNNAVIGDRSYGSDARVASACGAAFIDALQVGGVAGCAKHWPGHGDTEEDSHDALPASRHGLRRLESVEMAPFRAAVSANVASALVAHLLVPAMEPEAHRPASCSERCVTHLRKNLRFGDGVVIKHNANQRYATDAVTAWLFRELGERAGVPVQEFVVRSDLGCGSTIGPILSTRTGIRTVDVGAPQLSMHSVREMCGCDDVKHSVAHFTAVYEGFTKLDETLMVDGAVGNLCRPCD